MLDSDGKDVLLENDFNSRNRNGVCEHVVQGGNLKAVFYTDKNTGEILPFRTPFNVQPDEGVKNVHDDECVLSDYVPIKDQIKMFTSDDILRINQLDITEKELSDLDDVDLEDYVSEDELDTLTNLEELEQPLFSEQDMNQSDGKATTSSTSEAQQTDDTTAGSGGSAVSPSE